MATFCLSRDDYHWMVLATVGIFLTNIGDYLIPVDGCWFVPFQVLAHAQVFMLVVWSYHRFVELVIDELM